MNLFIIVLFASAVTSEVSGGASLKPNSICCDIPDFGEPERLSSCSNPKPPGPCNDIQCIFEEFGFLVDNNTLNKEAYKNHLLKWAENKPIWSKAIDKVVKDCVDKDLRQHLDVPCKAFDVFTCTEIAMMKKCPDSAWKC